MKCDSNLTAIDLDESDHYPKLSEEDFKGNTKALSD